MRGKRQECTQQKGAAHAEIIASCELMFSGPFYYRRPYLDIGSAPLPSVHINNFFLLGAIQTNRAPLTGRNGAWEGLLLPSTSEQLLFRLFLILELAAKK